MATGKVYARIIGLASEGVKACISLGIQGYRQITKAFVGRFPIYFKELLPAMTATI